MNKAKAAELLRSDRLRTEQLLADMRASGGADRTAADQPGDMFDSAEPLTEEGTDQSVISELEEHLAAIGRAEQRSRCRNLRPVGPTVGYPFPTIGSKPIPPSN